MYTMIHDYGASLLKSNLTCSPIFLCAYITLGISLIPLNHVLLGASTVCCLAVRERMGAAAGCCRIVVYVYVYVRRLIYQIDIRNLFDHY